MHGVDSLLDVAGVVVDSYAHAAAQAVEAPGLLQDMAHGQERHAQVAVRHGGEYLEMCLDGGVVVGVDDLDALWLAGGAGCVDEGGQVIGLAGHGATLHLVAHLLPGMDAQAHEIVPGDGDMVVGGKLQADVLIDDHLQHLPGIPLAEVVGEGVLAAVADEDDADAAVGGDEVELLLAGGGVYGNGGGAVAESAELGDEHLRGVGRAYGDAVARLQAEGAQRTPGHVHLHAELLPRRRQPLALLAPAEAVSLPVAVAPGLLLDHLH